MGLGAVGNEAAAASGAAEELVALVRPPRGPSPWASRLPVMTLATDAVALASAAVNLVAADRDAAPPAPVEVDRERVAASFGSERLIRIDGAAPDAWAPLSGFWRAADGWIRTHANYPHHDAALRTLLGLGADAGKDAAAAVIADRTATELEAEAARLGAVVVAMRTAAQWRAEPQGAAVTAAPLIDVRRTGDAPARPWRSSGAPLAGIRVLDLTRVIAGPIAARDLALAGADVLRLDPPGLPEIGWIHLDTGQGKRSTLLDLADTRDRAVFEDLLRQADVLLTGYRPGALARFGLDPEALADRHPGLVTASVSAWGTIGPWAGRRGFDSLVQAATGIAVAEAADDGTPGVLPAQALDHASGHLLAAGIALALRTQRRSGGSFDVRVALARTAEALLRSTDAVVRQDPSAAAPVRTRALDAGPIRSLQYAAPALAFTGAPDDYPVAGGAWGADEPAWAD